MALIIIEKTYSEFVANSSSEINSSMGNYSIKSEIRFPAKSKKQNIAIENQSIIFELIYPSINIKHFRFEEGKIFSLQDLIQLSQLFDFQIAPHVNHFDIQMGSLELVNIEYKNYCLGAYINNSTGEYLLIYSKRGETNFEENIIYVHGIWEIKLTEELSAKINNHN